MVLCIGWQVWRFGRGVVEGRSLCKFNGSRTEKFIWKLVLKGLRWRIFKKLTRRFIVSCKKCKNDNFCALFSLLHPKAVTLRLSAHFVRVPRINFKNSQWYLKCNESVCWVANFFQLLYSLQGVYPLLQKHMCNESNTKCLSISASLNCQFCVFKLAFNELLSGCLALRHD